MNDAKHIVLLIIEDNEGDVNLIREALAECSEPAFTIDVAPTLGDALVTLNRSAFDGILLDLSLPDSRGLETFHRVNAQVPSMPIIVLTGLDDKDLGVRAVNAGAQDYLVKGWAMAGGAGAWRSVLRDGPRQDSLIKGHEKDALVRVVRFAIERHRKATTAPLRPRPVTQQARAVTFFGAKGGVGTTTVALSVALSLSQQLTNTIAVELRRSFGSFSSMLNHFPEHNLKSLIDMPARMLTSAAVESALVEYPSRHLRILFGPQRLGSYPDIERPHVRTILRHLSELGEVVVIDVPSEPSEATREAICGSSFVGVVTDTDPTTLIAARASIALMRTWGVPSSRLGVVVVNRTGQSSDRNAVGLERQLTAPIIGVMPTATDQLAHERIVGALSNREHPDQALAIAADDLARRLNHQHLRASLPR